MVVSPSLTLAGLHRVMQLLTQGWDYHLRGERYGEPDPEYEFEVRVAETTRLLAGAWGAFGAPD